MRNVNELTISSREFNKLKSCFYVPLLGGILYTGECNKSKWGNRPLILVLGILELNPLHITPTGSKLLSKSQYWLATGAFDPKRGCCWHTQTPHQARSPIETLQPSEGRTWPGPRDLLLSCNLCDQFIATRLYSSPSERWLFSVLWELYQNCFP